MKKLTREILALLYYAVLLVIISSAWSYLEKLREETSAVFDSTPFYWTSFLISLLIGLYLGIPHLIRQEKQAGGWKFNLSRFFVVVLPLSILSLTPFCYFTFTDSLFFMKLLNFLIRPFTSYYLIEFGMISSIVLGIVLISCIYKDEKTILQ